MKNFLKQLFNKKTKSMQGKKVKLVKGTSGKPCSNNCYFGNGKEFIVADRYLYDKSWSLTDPCGSIDGWAYEWEMEGFSVGIEDLKKELSEAQTKLDTIQSKLDWLKETGSKEFSEQEFKVYQTLKLLENGKLSMVEKSKLIAELIKM
jgi:hypothetical protein